MPPRDFNSQVNLHSSSNMLLLKEKFQILNLRFLGLTLLVLLVLWLIGEGNGNPLQYSCLENPRDGGAWTAIYGRTESDTTEAT